MLLNFLALPRRHKIQEIKTMSERTSSARQETLIFHWKIIIVRRQHDKPHRAAECFSHDRLHFLSVKNTFRVS